MSECSLSKPDDRIPTSCARRPTEPLGFRSIALGYSNQFAFRAHALCGCRTRRTEEADRDEAAAPNPRRGSQPIDDLGSHHQAWEPRHTTLDSQLRHTYDTGEAQLRFPPSRPRPRCGSQSERRSPTHRRLGEPPPGLGASGSRGEAVDLSTGRLPRWAISTGWILSDE
jgi:hypothetical protein